MARRAASFSFWEGSGDKTISWRQYEVWTWHKTNITFTTSAHTRTDRVRQLLDACDCRWGGENPDFAEPPAHSLTSLKRLCVCVTHVKRMCVYTDIWTRIYIILHSCMYPEHTMLSWARSRIQFYRFTAYTLADTSLFLAETFLCLLLSYRFLFGDRTCIRVKLWPESRVFAFEW